MSLALEEDALCFGGGFFNLWHDVCNSSQISTRYTRGCCCWWNFERFCRARNILADGQLCSTVLLVIILEARSLSNVSSSTRLEILLGCLVMFYCRQSVLPLRCQWDVQLYYFNVFSTAVVSSVMMLAAGCVLSCILTGQPHVLVVFCGTHLSTCICGIFLRFCVR